MLCEMTNSLCRKSGGGGAGVTSPGCREVFGEEAGKLGRHSNLL